MEGIEFGGYFQQFVSWFAITLEVYWPAGNFLFYFYKICFYTLISLKKRVINFLYL